MVKQIVTLFAIAFLFVAEGRWVKVPIANDVNANFGKRKSLLGFEKGRNLGGFSSEEIMEEELSDSFEESDEFDEFHAFSSEEYETFFFFPRTQYILRFFCVLMA